MVDDKASIDKATPCVKIYVRRPVTAEVIPLILLGLEEEGIPAEIQDLETGTAKSIGKRAAQNSQLNVGIGLDGPAKIVVLHHRDLPEGKPLFLYQQDAFQARAFRRLGANAARLAKGNPLIFENATQRQKISECSVRAGQVPLKEIVDLVVAEFMKQCE
jgi:hypothetical protein